MICWRPKLAITKEAKVVRVSQAWSGKLREVLVEVLGKGGH